MKVFCLLFLSSMVTMCGAWAADLVVDIVPLTAKVVYCHGSFDRYTLPPAPGDTVDLDFKSLVGKKRDSISFHSGGGKSRGPIQIALAPNIKLITRNLLADQPISYRFQGVDGQAPFCATTTIDVMRPFTGDPKVWGEGKNWRIYFFHQSQGVTQGIVVLEAIPKL